MFGMQIWLVGEHHASVTIHGEWPGTLGNQGFLVDCGRLRVIFCLLFFFFSRGFAMPYTTDLVDELNTLIRFDLTTTQQGFKVHKNAEPAVIAATRLVFMTKDCCRRWMADI